MKDIKLLDILLNTKSNEKCVIVCISDNGECFAVDYGDELGRTCIETQKQKSVFIKTNQNLRKDE